MHFMRCFDEYTEIWRSEASLPGGRAQSVRPQRFGFFQDSIWEEKIDDHLVFSSWKEVHEL